MEDEEDKWYKKKNRSGKSIMKDTDKPLSTQAARFTNWMKNQYGDKVRVSSGDRGEGNHSKKNAFDIVGIDRLKKKDQDRIFKTALSMDVRVGNELKGKKGVDGWTGPHYHFDASKDQPSFIRGGTSGKAVRKKRTPKENKENTKWENRMQDLKEQESTEEIQGPPQQDQVNIQDSSIEKENNMVPKYLSRPSSEEEEEEKGSPTEIIQKTAKVIDESGSDVSRNMDPYTRERVGKSSLDVHKVERGGAKAQQADLDGEQVGIDDKFMSALGFFLPAVIGGIVGGQEGRAGAGVKLGLMASGEYHKAKNAHEELQLKKQQALAKKSQSKVDITPDFYNTENDEPVFSRQNESGGAEFFDASGKVIPASQVRPLKEKLSKAKQGFVQSRHQERMTEGYMKTWRKKADKDIEGIKNIDSITNLIDSGSPITTAQVATFNARALFNEVGRLSDQDVDRAVVGLPLYDTVKNNMHQYMTGTMTKQVKTITKELLRVAKKHQKGVLRNLVDKGMVQHRIDSSGLTEDQFRESLLMEAEVDLTDEEEKKKKKKGSLSDRLSKMSPEDRAAFEEYKKNRRNK